MDRILLRYTENTEAYESRNNDDVARVPPITHTNCILSSLQLLSRYEKDGVASDDEEMLHLVDSNEDISQGTVSSLVSPKEQMLSAVTSPAANLDQELERLLLEEARKQGVNNFDVVSEMCLYTQRHNLTCRALPQAASFCRICSAALRSQTTSQAAQSGHPNEKRRCRSRRLSSVHRVSPSVDAAPINTECL